jgi:hypothetical protein
VSVARAPEPADPPASWGLQVIELTLPSGQTAAVLPGVITFLGASRDPSTGTWYVLAAVRKPLSKLSAAAAWP